jgi:hypothetical protein
MGDKIKNLPRRELIPPYLSREERFAFRSPLPLDVCVRRLLAWDAGLVGRSRTQVSVENAGMTDHQFIIDSRQSQHPVWMVGTLSDIDGEATWVAGTIGVSMTSLAATHFVLLPLTIVLILCVLAGTELLGVGILTALAIAWFAYAIRTATHPTRRLLREVFDVEGDGLLPMETQPEETEAVR